ITMGIHQRIRQYFSPHPSPLPARGKRVPEGRVRGTLRSLSSRRANIAGFVAAFLAALPGMAAAQATPSFDCSQTLVSSVEQRICQDEKLATLDRELAGVYAAASAKAARGDAA